MVFEAVTFIAAAAVLLINILFIQIRIKKANKDLNWVNAKVDLMLKDLKDLRKELKINSKVFAQGNIGVVKDI